MLPQDNAADPSIKREISHLTLLNSSSRIRIRHLETNQSAPPPRGWVVGLARVMSTDVVLVWLGRLN